MREILFRGKWRDNGEWAVGSLVNAIDMIDDKQRTYIIEEAQYAGYGEFAYVSDVDPETIGQYTGLTDKNGKKIFEGDIVDLECDPDLNELWVFDFGNCGGVQNVAHDVGYMGFCLRPLSDNAIKERDYGQRDDPVYYLNALRLHIVGNIHDNPELLGGAEDG